MKNYRINNPKNNFYKIHINYKYLQDIVKHINHLINNTFRNIIYRLNYNNIYKFHHKFNNHHKELMEHIIRLQNLFHIYKLYNSNMKYIIYNVMDSSCNNDQFVFHTYLQDTPINIFHYISNNLDDNQYNYMYLFIYNFCKDGDIINND